MRNAIISGLTAAVLAFGVVGPVFANTYTDSNKIGDWSADHIEILTNLGVITGYPDGTFRPTNSITREEMAVMLLNGMVVLEDSINASIWEENARLYDELVSQQTQLLTALSAIDAVQAKEAVSNKNFVALSIVYNAEDSSVDDNAYISLDGKFEVVSISDSLTVSVRPFVNTTGEAGAAATLDYAITDKLTVAGGAGYAGSWSDGSALAGDSNGVGYGQANVDYSISDDTVVTLGAKVPFTGDNSGDVNFGLGLGIRW